MPMELSKWKFLRLKACQSWFHVKSVRWKSSVCSLSSHFEIIWSIVKWCTKMSSKITCLAVVHSPIRLKIQHLDQPCQPACIPFQMSRSRTEKSAHFFLGLFQPKSSEARKELIQQTSPTVIWLPRLPKLSNWANIWWKSKPSKLKWKSNALIK